MRISKVIHLLLLAIMIKTAVLGTMLIPDLPCSQQEQTHSGIRAAITREFLNPAYAQQPAEAAQQPADTLASLKERREELERREMALKTLEQELDAKLAKLQETQGRIEQMLTEAKETRDAKLRHLIDVYTNMKAKQAAAVIETLNEDIAVKILAGMRGRQAGEILTFVGAEKAAKLSEQLTRMQVPF
ncbi:MotE family protein [Megalodesulfovibrio paquesii]